MPAFVANGGTRRPGPNRRPWDNFSRRTFLCLRKISTMTSAANHDQRVAGDPIEPRNKPAALGDHAAAVLSEAARETSRQFFAENGYVILKNIVSRDKLAELRTSVIGEFERAQKSDGLFAGGGLISGHLNSFPGEESRFAYDTLQERGVIDLIKSMIPGSLGALRVGCNLNLPKSVAQHYHVDSSFTGAFMIVNVAVVDTDLVNGAIDVVPGTHKKFYKFWRFAIERPHRFHARLPMDAGDILIRTSTLWHRGMPNRSAIPRPMLAMTFGDDAGGPAPADAFQINQGKVAFFPNWYRPSFLGRLRERTFVTAPVTYSAYRFVRSLYGSKGYNTQ